MTEGYLHGPVDCHACFQSSSEIAALEASGWRLSNNPGYWGSSDPKILILGFSKGANQIKVARGGQFDAIPFAGVRPRLQSILARLGVMPVERNIDSLMTDDEADFGFASLVRCSLCKVHNGVYTTSGTIIRTALTTPVTRLVIERCARTFLQALPKRLRLVVLLGSATQYGTKTRRLISQLYQDYQPTNPVAFYAAGLTWIYSAHPSKANGHLREWLTDPPHTKQGRKRDLALEAVRAALRPELE